MLCSYITLYVISNRHQVPNPGLALLTLSCDKNWDSHSLVNSYPSFYPRIALVAPSPGVKYAQKLFVYVHACEIKEYMAMNDHDYENNCLVHNNACVSVVINMANSTQRYHWLMGVGDVKNVTLFSTLLGLCVVNAPDSPHKGLAMSNCCVCVLFLTKISRVDWRQLGAHVTPPQFIFRTGMMYSYA